MVTFKLVERSCNFRGLNLMFFINFIWTYFCEGQVTTLGNYYQMVIRLMHFVKAKSLCELQQITGLSHGGK